MRWRDWLSARFGAAAIAIAILLVGSAYRWTQALVAMAALGALLPIAWSRRVFARISPLIALLGIALLLCVIQIVPLPHALVEMLSPTNAGLRSEGADLMHFAPRSTLSFDVPGTLAAIGYFLILLAIAIVALRISTSELGRYRVVATVAGLCGLAALITGVHYVFGIWSLYGIFTPSAGPPVIGPIVNPNHLGCLMAVGTSAAIGLAAYQKQKSWVRVLWVAVVAACGLCALATLSRGAALALGAGAFVTVGALVAQRWRASSSDVPRRRSGFWTSSLPIAIIATCTVVVVLYAGSSGISQQISNSSFSEIHSPRSKYAAWKSTLELIDESPWTGVGRGAFEAVFTRVHPASGFSTFSHAENEYLQAIVDWGAPGALLLAFAAIWLVVVACRRWRDGALAAGALGAMAAVMLQSNVDYGIELLGLAAPVTALASTLAYVPLREATRSELSRRYGVRIAHLAALAIAALLLLSGTTRSLDDDHLALQDQRGLTLDRLRDPMERHPLDYFNYALAAQVMVRDHDKDAIRVLNHAMTLHPTHSGLHLVAAHLLFDTHHAEQSTGEYALAWVTSKNRRALIDEITKRFPAARAADALPTDPKWIDEVVPDLIELNRRDIERAWLDRVLDIHPQLIHACELLYDLATKAPDLAQAVVEDRRCTRYEAARETRIGLARTLISNRQFAVAAHLLEDVDNWQNSGDLKLDAWLLRCDAAIGLGHEDDARKCLRRLDIAGIVPPERANELTTRLDQLRHPAK